MAARSRRRRVAIATSVAAIATLTPVVLPSAPVDAAGAIAYPDLISVIPTNEMGITHPTPTTKEFDYTHIVYNAGTGPLEVQPTNYDSATNLATGVQNLYSYDANGNRVLEQQHTATDQFFFHSAHGGWLGRELAR